MKAIGAALALLLVVGCDTVESYRPKSVTEMLPGFGVMVADFKYVPGKSDFPKSQILADARYTAERLSAMSYQPFIVYGGRDIARVGVRASSHHFAEALRREIDRTGKIDLGDGTILPVTKAEIINIAELKIGALDEVK